MANRSFYHPKPPRRQQDDGSVYDHPGTEVESPQGDVKGQEASAAADQTLNNIDDALNDSATPEQLNEAEEDAAPSFFNPRGDSAGESDTASDSAAAGGKDLSTAENEGGKDGGLFNPHGDKGGRFGGIKKKVSKIASNKLLVGVTLGSTGGIFILIALVILMVGPYKVVDFAEHVAVYQFARTTRQMAEQTDRVTAEKIAIDSADDGTYAKLKAKYADGAGKVKDTWSKFDKYRPNKIISNFGDEGKLKFNYKTGAFGRQTLQSVTLNGQEVAIKNSTTKNLIPGYKFGKTISFSRDFAPTLNDTLKANEVGPLVRARVASQIRKQLGITLTAWVVGKYAGKTQLQAEAQIEQDAYRASQGTSTPEDFRTSTSDKLNDTAEAAAEARDKALSTEAGAIEAAQTGGQLPASVQQAIEASITAGSFSSAQAALESALKIINPVYGIAVPLCLIYDGSLTNSGPTMSQQSAQLQRSAIWVQAASSQTKDGRNATPEAVGAADWKLGDVTHTNAEKRASGLPVDTSNYASVEASPAGQYSISDALLPEPLGSTVDKLASACPVLTNLWGGIALGVGNIALVIATGGGAGAGEAGVEASADAVIPSIASRLAAKVFSSGTFLKTFAKDTVKQGAVIGGATLIAKLYVMSQIGASHNSLATGPQYADDVDNGTNLYANQVEQQQFYGAPLADSELSSDNSLNTSYLADAQAQKSAFDRYLAVTNPDSLLSHVGLSLSSFIGPSFGSSLPRLASQLLNPIKSVGSLVNGMGFSRTFAAANTTSVNTYYGNVQFGFTRAENSLMQNDPTFSPLANQDVLDASGKEQDIADKYTQCFDGSESVGDMLANGQIKRDSQGNVLADGSLCSPASLGLENSTYGPYMVFRWRLAQSYNNTMDQLTDQQDVTN